MSMSKNTILNLDLILCAALYLLFSLPGFGFSATSKSSKEIASSIYSGILTKKNKSYSLQLSNSTEKYALAFNDTISQEIIQRLTTGDFVSIQALNMTKNILNKTLNIVSINYIGLNVLLGSWLGDDNVCYCFKNFTSFIIFNPTQTGACVLPNEPLNPKQSRKMSYFVNPDIQDWFLLISDKKVQYAAELLIKTPKTIQFNLFDQETGAIVSKVILRR
jgi:hypothetical protein